MNTVVLSEGMGRYTTHIFSERRDRKKSECHRLLLHVKQNKGLYDIL